jgi:hypothetical protein
MKVSFATFLASAAFINSAASIVRCETEDITGTVVRYHVRSANVVSDIPGICGGLWDNLKRFTECATPSNTWCGDAGGGILGWYFNAFDGCKGGMVESTWWEATRNSYGDINCP